MKEVAKYLDHTNINPGASVRDIKNTCEEAKHFAFRLKFNMYFQADCWSINNIITQFFSSLLYPYFLCLELH